MSKSITAKEVKDHATPETGLYIIIDGSVYSMAEFADEHPGGSKILKRFWKYHNEGVLKKYQERLKVGELKEEAKL
ncbi:hypothetical protein E4T48_03657 [Aureobasidium sp. EXF-10727]|nr:hypothetical protein E4T48_03657 [Aureobasidium sp. EXF-10727]